MSEGVGTVEMVLNSEERDELARVEEVLATEVGPAISDCFNDRRISKSIKNKEFDLVLSDDISGRIPALVAFYALTHIYGALKHTSPRFNGFRGYKPALSTHDQYKGMLSKLLKLDLEETKRKGKKVLVITDVIYTGTALLPGLELLNEMGLSPGVLSILGSEQASNKELEEHFGATVATGSQKRSKGKSTAGVRSVKNGIVARQDRDPDAAISATRDPAVSDALAKAIDKALRTTGERLAQEWLRKNRLP